MLHITVDFTLEKKKKQLVLCFFFPVFEGVAESRQQVGALFTLLVCLGCCSAALRPAVLQESGVLHGHL